MKNSRRSMFVLLIVAALVSLLPALASADGGPILSDPELWAMIDEGQQIAVVQLQQDGTAQVDLFISLTDRSGQSHEVTFFLPLGVGAADLSVVEEMSLDFDRALTAAIDKRLEAASHSEEEFRQSVQFALLLGTLTTHAAWLSPVALISAGLFPMWGAMGALPVATFETASSQIAVYDINPETDLQALIETTGLDQKVRGTLAALEGQQIAVIKLRTQPVSAAEEASHDSWESTGQPGIHLGWGSTLVPHAAGATYTYPLGTGQAWASPIERTRVYVVSPPELDFTVEYPRLGDDLSRLGDTRYDDLAWAIKDAESPAFAVTEAYGKFGHIWRSVYIKSNSAEDVVVTTLPELSLEMQRAIRQARVQGVIGVLTWFLAPLAGLASWVAAWRVVMPRQPGAPYRWREGKLYRDALTWAGWYLITILVALLPAGLVLFLGALFWPLYLLWVVAVPLAILSALGLISAYLYARWKAEELQVTRGQAFGAYMLVVVVANVLYLAFAAAYYAIACAI